jgi:hypothetical protein
MWSSYDEHHRRTMNELFIWRKFAQKLNKIISHCAMMGDAVARWKIVRDCVTMVRKAQIQIAYK